MKNSDKETVSRLDELPKIGKAMSKDLQLIGIAHLAQHQVRSMTLVLLMCLCRRSFLWKADRLFLGGHLQKSENTMLPNKIKRGKLG